MSMFTIGTKSFNTQPPEGGWFSGFRQIRRGRDVSTHSRLKAAGSFGRPLLFLWHGFNTQPPEGGWN